MCRGSSRSNLVLMVQPILLPPRPQRPPVERAFSFGPIVCAVDDSRGALEAAAQASRLAGPKDTLTFVSIARASDDGRAARAVESARAAAHADGVEAATEVLDAQDVSAAILDFARGAGLLVVSARGRSRSTGALMGSTIAKVVRGARGPLLVARSVPELGFPAVVLAAARGLEDRRAIVVAATVAGRCGTRVVLGNVGRSSSAVRDALPAQAAVVLAITGKDPVTVSVHGPPVDRLPAMASSVGAGLLVLGGDGRRDVGVLTTVSEQVAHRAACSVLVL